MKITKEDLERIIKQELDEAYKSRPMTKMTQMDIEQPDPMDFLFEVMDKVVDKALMYYSINDQYFVETEYEADLSPLANEIVTRRFKKTGKIDDIEDMADELINRYNDMRKKGQRHPDRL